LNDIAIAIRALCDEQRVARAAVIDTDVHQGNGTARIFLDDPSVFTFSIHQENNYISIGQSWWSWWRGPIRTGTISWAGSR
jgi:acetoin utilization deacetylase AcuC-like enzyme